MGKNQTPPGGYPAPPKPNPASADARSGHRNRSAVDRYGRPAGLAPGPAPTALIRTRQRSGTGLGLPKGQQAKALHSSGGARAYALARLSHTFCDTEAIRSEKVSRCKSLTAVGQADPFRQSDVQPSGGRLMDIG